MERQHILQQWLASQLCGVEFSMEPASSDASFRRYFRISAGNRTLIAMDAPPSHEDCGPFVSVAERLKKVDVHAPEILAQNMADGFLLLSDLGVTMYLDVLNEASAENLYHDARKALIKMQGADVAGLPVYDEALLLREMNLFPEWYIAKHLAITLSAQQQNTLASVFREIVQNNLVQPRVFVHRDYHSRNLMVSEPNPGVIDFQDAVYGPITYDLVSLFKDAYIAWPEEKVLDWVIRYWEQAKAKQLPVTGDFAEFYRDFEWMGVQRHLKILGIFARLYYRDGKAGYLKDLPLVMSYLRKACARYRELSPLLKLLDTLEGADAQVGYTF